jgi:hypothetical protein
MDINMAMDIGIGCERANEHKHEHEYIQKWNTFFFFRYWIASVSEISIDGQVRLVHIVFQTDNFHLFLSQQRDKWQTSIYTTSNSK